MNIFDEVENLPRRSQIALAAFLLRESRPSVSELAHAAAVDQDTLRAWLVNERRRFTNKSVAAA